MEQLIPLEIKNFMYYTYVIESQKSKYHYTGSTNNLRKRFEQHITGKSIWTRSRGPWRLIYYEACLNKEDAKARENYLKSGMGKRYLKNRPKRFLFLTG